VVSGRERTRRRLAARNTRRQRDAGLAFSGGDLQLAGEDPVEDDLRDQVTAPNAQRGDLAGADRHVGLIFSPNPKPESEILNAQRVRRCAFGCARAQRAAKLQAIYAAMGDVSDATRLYVHRVTSRMLRHAAQWGIVQQNVATLVDAPKARTSEGEVLTPKQVNMVLEALQGHWLHPIAVLALGSGARRGELLGLRWRDLDLDSGTMRIERAVEQTRQGIAIKSPKTRHGRRVVTLAPVTIDVLRVHRRAQQEQWLALGRGKVAPEMPAFATIDGEIMSPRSISKAWERTTKRLGIGASFHSLRHTHASTLLAEGVDPVTVSRRLGHGSAAITLSTYAHVMRPDDRAAAIIQRVLGPISPGAN
jgi:integrase